MYQHRDATFGERVIAFVIDYFVVMGIYLTLFVSLTFNIFQPEGLILIYIIIGFVILYTVIKDIPGGRSIGKNRLNLEIRANENESESPQMYRLFLRNVFLLLLPLELIISLLTPSRRRLGDILTNTRVVKIKSSEKFNGNYTKEYLDPRGYPFNIIDKK